jgi:hypothetical protein
MLRLAVGALVLAAPVTTASGGAPVDQTPPVSINGITADGDTLWLASIDDPTLAASETTSQ